MSKGGNPLKEERKKSINITTELWRDLQRAKADTGKALSVLMEEAWVASRSNQTAPASAPVAPAADPDYQMLDMILTKGNKEQRQGIRTNLKAFSDAIELGELKAMGTPPAKRRVS